MDKIGEDETSGSTPIQKGAQGVQSNNDDPYSDVNESPTREQMLKIVKGMAVRLHLDPNHVHNHLYLKERFCSNPFKNVTTALSSFDRKTQKLKLKAYVCCVGFLPVPIKEDISDNDNWENFWNSERAMEIRRSVLDGDFSYCLENCTALKCNSLPLKRKIKNPYFRDIIDNHKTKLERGPLQISFAHDNSCNLACESCRPKLKIASKELNESYDLLLENMIKPWLNSDLDYPITVLVGDNGDPFFSKHYRDISGVFDHKKHLNVKLRIQTNGLLFEKYWPELKNIHPLVKQISVSCDACSKNVYKIIRGGSWRLLKKNLRFIARERKRLNVPEFFINFVVQESNFREMKDFVTFGKRLGVSRVRFTLMRHMNQEMSMSDYLMRAIHLDQHPRHEEFLEYLRDSVFANPIVDFRDLMPLYRKVGMV